MASIVKKQSSKFWFAAYRDVNGRQHRKSTRTTDRKQAERIAHILEQVAQHKIPSHKVRETIAAVVREVYGPEVPSATVREFVTQWLTLKKPDLAESTSRNYQNSAAKLIAFLGPAADRDIAEVRKVQIAEFRNKLQLNLAPGTANGDLQCVKAIFQAAAADGYLQENPAQYVKSIPRHKINVRRAFTIPELRSILEVAGDEWRSLIKFGLYTGQRLGDLARMTWANIDLQRETITIVPRKTRRSIVCPICEPLMEHIIRLDASGPRAPIHPKLHPKKINTLSHEFTELLIAVGLRAPENHATTGRRGRGRRNVSELSFHCLRITAVSLLKDAGVPAAVVQELVGHESARISQLYTRVGPEALKRATSVFPAL